MIYGLIRAASLSLFLLAIAAATAGLPTAAFAQSQASTQSQQSASVSPSDEYVLGPNDRIRLKVYGETDITGDYEVDNNGFVSIPLAGHLRAGGLTTRQLERAIASALSKKELCAIRA
jgi:polysaccharide biosynthesis/export protein